MKTHPIDLRSKIVAAYKNNEGTMLRLAYKFGVSRSFVQKIIHQEKRIGTVRPLIPRGRKPKLLPHSAVVKKILIENPHATKKELCKLLDQKINVKVSYSTIYRFMQTIEYNS